MSHPHYFIGIPIGEQLKRTLADLQNTVQQEVEYKTWTHEEDFHVTLAFLGSVSEERMESLQNALRRCTDLQAFTVNVEGIGTFGHPAKPRVMWAGVERNQPLVELQQHISDVTEEQGFTKDKRPYKPHITLAKKWNSSAALSTQIEQMAPSSIGQLVVNTFCIFKIHPQNSPKYEIIETVTLKGEGEK
ncbi:RNA 2',3'-cyclic phosphodiesterase [Pontibacillus salicampi]|uniref:RNA 2',3'-cyclic phosphodiesterase n=1 Tax=Pontibacillus salicampi TaxID=1449801 RepID=A0ABV6LIQ1_9BACI